MTNNNNRRALLANNYHHLLQGRDSGTEGLESVEGAESRSVDLSEGAIRERLCEAESSLREFVKRELGDDAKLQEVIDEIIRRGDAGLRALREDAARLANDPELVSGLEAIARTDGSRPSFLIRDGGVDLKSSPVGSWKGKLVASQDLLNQALACIGRVNIGDQHVGTGFLIQENLILTNRHVLQDIANVDANGNWIMTNDAVIDFGYEHPQHKSFNRRQLERVLFAGGQRILPFSLDHNKLDLALISLRPGRSEQAPLRVLSFGSGSQWAKLNTAIYTVGYPGPPKHNLYPTTLLELLFQKTYGCKRLAPGELVSSRSTVNKWTLTHDATTLGGNSGSAVLVMGNELVAAGLHYGGRPQVETTPGENWGHVLGSILDQTDGFHSKTLGEILNENGVVLLGDNGNGGLGPYSGPGPNNGPQPNDSPRPNIDPRAELAAEKLVADISRGPLPGLTNAASAAATVNSNSTVSAAALNGYGTVSITVPLHIQITLGAPQVAPEASVSRTEGLFGRAQPTPPTTARFSLDSLATTDFRWRTALSLALASKLAYSPLGAVQMTGLNDWRLQTCVFLEMSETQCFVASTPDAVFVAFRGTAGVRDWIADLNVGVVRRPYGTIHRGFHFAYQDIRPQLEQVLAKIGNRRLLLTGHSLGAALATIAACELSEPFRVAHLYTFGQPRVGWVDFRNSFNQRYGNVLYRFVNNDDIVTRIPPGFQHVGRLFHFDAQGRLQGQAEAASPANETSEGLPLTQAEFDLLRADCLARRASQGTGESALAVPAIAAPELEGLLPSISDHGMDEYIRKIALQIGS
jgi:hypothetical protein